MGSQLVLPHLDPPTCTTGFPQDKSPQELHHNHLSPLVQQCKKLDFHMPSQHLQKLVKPEERMVSYLNRVLCMAEDMMMAMKAKQSAIH